MEFQVKLWGIRGSLPTPHHPDVLEKRANQLLTDFTVYQKNSSGGVNEFLSQLPAHKYRGWGGNTACIEVTTATESLIIDGGSGIRRLGERLMMGPCGIGKGQLNILLTHYHWDHLIGLPFFIPIFIPGNQIHFYAVSPGLEENVRRMFNKPNFPVPFERLGAKIHFHQISPREKMNLSGFDITPYQLDHPDPCWGYLLERGGKRFAYCVDTECIRVSPSDLGADLALYQNLDLMVFDAQYTFSEAAEKVDWGHASAPVGLDIAMREGAKRVVFVHHDPGASDEKIAEAEAQTREYYDVCLKNAKRQKKPINAVDWEFAYEGLIIDV